MPSVSSIKVPDLQQLGRYAITRSLFKPTSLMRAIARLGFVQADPMRAPARAQDLILAHRVKDYRAGELERRCPLLPIEEAFFINYGFLPRETLALLHPRGTPRAWDTWDAKMQARPSEVLAFVGSTQGQTERFLLKQKGREPGSRPHTLKLVAGACNAPKALVLPFRYRLPVSRSRGVGVRA